MSKIEVNQISSQCGSTLTIGQSGDTVTLACGATQSGFGQTYSAVSYCTTAKTAPFTGVSGKGYFINTSCGAVTVTLPATPTAGDIISIADYASTWQTNKVTLCNNGSLINGVCATAALNTQGQSITLVYVDGTRGWKNTMDSTSNVSGTPGYLVACGGTETTCGNYKIHTFTSDGTFTVSIAADCAAYNKVDYLVVAGGGSGNSFSSSGGGGAGGFRESKCATVSGCYTASPLATPTSLPVSVQSYPITVGAGGSNSPYPSPANPGSNSIFSTITSTGGGNGGRFVLAGASGGSGGGGGGGPGSPALGGAGNTPPVSPPQGNNGGCGAAATGAAGGGGGAGGIGSNDLGPAGGPGGTGATSSITGTPVIRAGGGGGGTESGTNGTGGPGGGGNAGPGPSTAAGDGSNGTANTGGGGGGSTRGSGTSGDYAGGTGGSGVVIVRYRYQ